jgi:hypothetical protein
MAPECVVETPRIVCDQRYVPRVAQLGQSRNIRSRPVVGRREHQSGRGLRMKIERLLKDLGVAAWASSNSPS